MRLRSGWFSGRSRDQFVERREAPARRGPVAFGVRLNLIEEDANLLAAVAFGYGLHGLSPFARQYSSAAARGVAARRAGGAVRLLVGADAADSRGWRGAATMPI